jgi:hypothetical protein
MKTRILCVRLCLASSLVTVTASAQPNEVEKDPTDRISVSYRPGFNIKMELKNLGRPGVAGGPSVTGLSYADGFVRPNSEPNDLGLSWNWGYQNASQVVGNNIVMTGSQRGNLASGREDAPANGVELSYNRRLGHWGKSRWGLEGALNYTDVDISKNSTPAGSVLTAHAFNLGGQLPPVAPYAGSPDGPGILISGTPTTAALNVHSKLDATVVGLRLGPYLELPLGERLAVSVSGGFALAWVDSDLSFQEEVSVGGAQGVTRAGTGSNSEWLPGWYIAGNLSVKLSHSTSVFAGVQFQDVGDHFVRALDKEVKLGLGDSIFLTAGLNFSF